MSRVTTANFMPGDRVLAFDHRLYRDDVSTPIAFTVRPATVVARYGKKCHYPVSEVTYVYPDLCDLSFDHRADDVSRGHFTDGLRAIARDHDGECGHREEH